MDSCTPSDSADPDVAGIGVLISFAASSFLTILAILVAYFGQALRPDRYSPLDKTFIIMLGRRSKASEESVKRRIAAFESFIKALSDQQLFTGLALTVAIYLLRYGVNGLDAKVSAYSYCLAVQIALLSCFVHLSAVTILRDHLEKFKRLRNARILVMLITIRCLIPQLVLTQLIDSGLTLRCALDPETTDLYLVSWTNEIYNYAEGYYHQTIFLATVSILWIIIWSYLRRLLELLSPLFRDSPERFSAVVFHWLSGWPSTNKQEKLERKASAYIEEQSLEVPAYGPLKFCGTLLSVIIFEFPRSFMAEIIWLLFYTTYALCQILFFIFWGPEPGRSPVSFSLGFGQILPMVLLGLPVLSALELYSEWKSHNVEDEQAVELQDMRVRANTPLQPVTNSNLSLTHTQDRHLTLYNLYIEQHTKITCTFTALLVVVCAVLVILGGIVLSGCIWSATRKSDEVDYPGYCITVLFFVAQILTFVFSFATAQVWIVRKRFERPASMDTQMSNRLVV
ncbi:hypothetical protein CEP54_001267 [Fusarium duplospermum]|uniref:Uncharacterized protein n=1 Tax=Fusarium duplospermum TaxID=1325734 RepID=A0A428R233_9HYPO|nr:hypothetical protein CEP54_001267 [Fusarium duplospermum]